MQNVIIINYNSLYEIFDDLKENLPFNILNLKMKMTFLKIIILIKKISNHLK